MEELTDPFRRLLADACPSGVVRAIERGGAWQPLWDAFAESGFLDALVAERHGGAGLALADVAPLFALLGASAVPLPVADTMVARAILSEAGARIPSGPIVLAACGQANPFAGFAAYGLQGCPTNPHLVDLDESGLPLRTAGGETNASTSAEMRPLAAAVRAQLIAGAADKMLEMTVRYANERAQFGKPIGKQQAVQQQLAELAELVLASRIAAAIGMRAGLELGMSDAAVAKYVTSAAVPRIAAIGHAVHGAIGISEEHDLQLLTRRLHAWRLANGSESYWAEQLGGWMLSLAAAGELGLLPFPGRASVDALV